MKENDNKSCSSRYGPVPNFEEYDPPGDDEAKQDHRASFRVVPRVGRDGHMTTHFPRPAILDRIPHEHHAVIEASAGTGKTYTIEHIVVDLILRGRVPLTEILVLTFTERAATELRQRIRSKIESILLVADEGAKPVARQPGGGWLIDEAARQNLSRALLTFDGASIGTIHGFFGRVLTEHAFTSGRLFDGTLEDGRTLFGRAFKMALRRSLARRPSDAADLLALWLEQSRGGIEKLESLLWTCHSSRRRILPPFSVKAMHREIESNPLFDIDLTSEADQFKAGAQRGEDQCQYRQRDDASDDYPCRSDPGFRSKLADRTRRHISRRRQRSSPTDLKNRDLAGDVRNRSPKRSCVLIEHWSRLRPRSFRRACRSCRSFWNGTRLQPGSSTTTIRSRGLRSHSTAVHGDELIRTMRARYRFALIDEFQDTDELQWSFFERVFIESEGRNLVYPDRRSQASDLRFPRGRRSYLPRGSRRVEQAGTPLVPLMENFRSTRALIDAYNSMLDPSANPSFFDGEIRYDQPVTAGRELVALQADGSPATPIHLLKIEPRDGDLLSTGELKRGLARQIAREARDLLSDEKGLRFGPERRDKADRARRHLCAHGDKQRGHPGFAGASRGGGAVRVLQAGWVISDRRGPRDSRSAGGDRRPGRHRQTGSRLDHALLRRPAGSTAGPG